MMQVRKYFVFWGESDRILDVERIRCLFWRIGRMDSKFGLFRIGESIDKISLDI